MNLYPEYIFKDVTHINPKIMKGKKLFIFDIDNTLFYSETTVIREDILHWFKATHKKYPCICFSNSFSIQKRKPVLEKTLGCKVFISTHKKPSKELFQEIVQEYKVQAKDVLVIGDFHFTDVLFANRNHASSVLVRPLGGEKKLSLWFARVIENMLLFILALFSSEAKEI